MSSRKEQKEALRREREQRERAAKAAERRRRLIGYGVAGGLVAVVAVVLAVLLLSGGGDGGDNEVASVFPDGGSVADQRETDLERAVEAAGCELKSVRARSRDHTADIEEEIDYGSNPPTSGRHYQEAVADGIYDEVPPDSAVVHSLEHGRIVVWVRPTLSRDVRADLKAFFDEDPYHVLMLPRRDMPYQVAATAWNADPPPNGTGRLLGCPRFGERGFDALRAFYEEHRDNGPEVVP